MGVKYVSSDTNDWFLSVNAFNDTYALLLAPEPKLQWFGLGLGRGVVLAEDFYAPTYLRFVLTCTWNVELKLSHVIVE
jgi:N-acetylneuraminate lyase